jgi:hypothetical protein
MDDMTWDCGTQDYKYDINDVAKGVSGLHLHLFQLPDSDSIQPGDLNPNQTQRRGQQGKKSKGQAQPGLEREGWVASQLYPQHLAILSHSWAHPGAD